MLQGEITKTVKKKNQATDGTFVWQNKSRLTYCYNKSRVVEGLRTATLTPTGQVPASVQEDVWENVPETLESSLWCSYSGVFREHLQETSKCLCKEVGEQREARRAEKHIKPPERANNGFHIKAWLPSHLLISVCRRNQLTGKWALRPGALSWVLIVCFALETPVKQHFQSSELELSVVFPSFQHYQTEKFAFDLFSEG